MIGYSLRDDLLKWSKDPHQEWKPAPMLQHD